MKCIKYKHGEICRVNDNIAEEAVRSGHAIYIPKSEWKRFERGQTPTGGQR